MPESYAFVWLLNGNMIQVPLSELEKLEHFRREELKESGHDHLVEMRDVFGSDVTVLASFICGWHVSTPDSRLAASIYTNEEDD
jgi:hypothetical protein